MAEDDPPVDRKGAQHMRGLAVVESIEAAAQGLAVEGHRCRDDRVPHRGVGKACGMRPEHPLHLQGIKAVQDEAHRRISRSAAERHAEGGVQPFQVGLDEGVNLPV